MPAHLALRDQCAHGLSSDRSVYGRPRAGARHRAARRPPPGDRPDRGHRPRHRDRRPGRDAGGRPAPHGHGGSANPPPGSDLRAGRGALAIEQVEPRRARCPPLHRGAEDGRLRREKRARRPRPSGARGQAPHGGFGGRALPERPRAGGLDPRLPGPGRPLRVPRPACPARSGTPDPTTGFRHHGVLNILVATARAVTGGAVEEALAELRPDTLAAEAAAVSPAPATAARPVRQLQLRAAWTSRWAISEGSAACRGPDRRDRPWPVRPLRPSTVACGFSRCWRRQDQGQTVTDLAEALDVARRDLPPAGHPRGPRTRRGRRRQAATASASAWSRSAGACSRPSAPRPSRTCASSPTR